MSKYAVLGKPVEHSKSPQIHALFAEQTQQELSYEAIPVEEPEFAGFVADFFKQGGGGLNITVPYKGNAFALAASCSPRAELAKAVNTLFLDETGTLCGDNTDGIGLMTDLKKNNGVAIDQRRVLILGAGGAVRGVLAALAHEQASEICIVNRTESKAEQLREEFAALLPVEAMSYAALQAAAANGRSFDLIINGTAASLQGEAPAIDAKLLAQDCCCYDLMYAASDTPFVAWAKANGASLGLDGLGMLVEQAAEAFALWRGVRPETAPVIERLRNQS